MKVILAHKFLYLTGGTEQYFRDLAAILAQHGHETIPFGLDDPRNPPTPYSQYLLATIDYRNRSLGYRIKNARRMIARTLYSWEAKRAIDKLIRETRPDVAHLQSIEHHISPSILHALKKHRIPMVQSVNTYKHMCASYRLYLFDKQEICERCSGGHHYHAVKMRCVKGSRMASLLGAVEMYLHQNWLKIYHHIHRFIVPNRFMEQKMLAAGYPQRKLVRLLNPLDLSEYEASDEYDGFVLYFGRIDAEKGVLQLVQAMKKLTKLKLVVVGDGQDMDRCVNWAKSNGAANVEFVGAKWGEHLRPYLMRCRLVVVPSLWYEPSPYVIYQALASGKAVVGSRLGGIPELLNEQTGALTEPGNVDDLAAKIEAVGGDEKQARQMGRAARQWAQANLCPQRYYDKLVDVYDQARREMNEAG